MQDNARVPSPTRGARVLRSAIGGLPSRSSPLELFHFTPGFQPLRRQNSDTYRQHNTGGSQWIRSVDGSQSDLAAPWSLTRGLVKGGMADERHWNHAFPGWHPPGGQTGSANG